MAGTRRTTRKSAPPPKNLSIPTAEPNSETINSPLPNAETLIVTKPEFKEEKTLPEPQPETSTAAQNAETLIAAKPELEDGKTLPEPQSETSTTAQNAETLIAAKQEFEEEKTRPESQPETITTAQNAEALASAEGSVNVIDDAKGIESGEKEVVTDSGDHNNSGNDANGNGVSAKPKKVVKKTVKVVKKVIKKVPKKVAKLQVDELNKGAGVNVEESGPVDVVRDDLETVNRAPEGLVSMEVEENKGDVNENKDEGLEQELKESEFKGNVENNVGDVEVKDGDSEEMGDGEGEKEKANGGEDEVGEGKLLSGELEAMERKKRRKTEVFVGGLDRDAKEEDVRKVFSEAGEIVDLRVVTRSRTGKKFAFLRYACAEDAKRALDTFAKVKICGKECGATPVEGNDTIFLGNVNKSWKDEDVVNLLNKIGIDKIDKVTVMIDPNNSDCNRGFAFIEFESIRDAQVAYSKLQEKGVFGKNLKLKVAWAEPLKELDEEEMSKVKTVYVEFIPASWDEDKVRDTFKKFGEIDDIVLARNLQKSKRKDFAFITYQTRVAAVKCIESFGQELKDADGTKVNVKVSLAKPISKRKERQTAKPVAKKAQRASPKTSISSHRPHETVNRTVRTHPSIQRYGVRNPEMSSTNMELVRLLREQASWKPPHASLSNSAMDIHHNPLSGRKRQFSLVESDPLSGELNRYSHSRLDDRYSVASSSHNLLPPRDLTDHMAYNHRHRGYPYGSHYGARNFASNIEPIEIRNRGHVGNFLHWQR